MRERNGKKQNMWKANREKINKVDKESDRCICKIIKRET